MGKARIQQQRGLEARRIGTEAGRGFPRRQESLHLHREGLLRIRQYRQLHAQSQIAQAALIRKAASGVGDERLRPNPSAIDASWRS